jgi:hypothetical protein
MLSRPLNIKTVTIGEVLQGLLLKSDKKENIEKDMAILIAKAVLNKLNSGNMRAYVRISQPQFRMCHAIVESRSHHDVA